MTVIQGLRKLTQEMLEFKVTQSEWQDPIAKGSKEKQSHKHKDSISPDFQLLTYHRCEILSLKFTKRKSIYMTKDIR